MKERIYNNQYKKIYPAIVPAHFPSDYGAVFPTFEKNDVNISVKEYYTKKELDFFFRVGNDWAHITREADIQSKPSDLTHIQTDDFHICPANSKRNIQQQGSFINHVIEYGTFYHRLIPESILSWKKDRLNPPLTAKAIIRISGNLLFSLLIYDVRGFIVIVQEKMKNKNSIHIYTCQSS